MTHLDRPKEKFWRLMKDIGGAMLTTRDAHVLRSRPMGVHVDEESRLLWIFAHADDHLDVELDVVSDANLSFLDPENKQYVSVSGQASMIDDRQTAADLWSPAIAAWYAEGLDDPKLRLVRIAPIQGEYWDAESRSMKRFLEIARANLGAGEPELTEKRKISVR